MVKSSCMLKHLEEDLSCHGEAVGDDWLLIWWFSFPTVQLQAAAAGQQTLAVHLRGRNARELTSCKAADRETTTTTTRKWLSDARHESTWLDLREACDLSGMCCERTWQSSGVMAGSCPDTWPACPAWQRLSLVPSGNLRDLLGRSDLQVKKKHTLKYSVSPSYHYPLISQPYFCLNWRCRAHICQSEPWSGPAAGVETVPRSAWSPSVSHWGTWWSSLSSWLACWSWSAQLDLTISAACNVVSG